MRSSWLAVFALACSSAQAPSIEDASTTVFGAPVDVTYRVGGHTSHASGELLAVDPQSIYVGTEQGTVVIPTKSVVEGDVYAFDAEEGSLAMWTTLGTASTLSHGLVLIFSAPVWLFVGVPVTIAESYSGEWDVRDDPEELRRWARFPQGIPQEYFVPR